MAYNQNLFNPSSTGSNLFGNPTQSTSTNIFGNSINQNTDTSLFNNPQNTNTSPNIFGNPTNQNITSSSLLTNPTGSLFSNPQKTNTSTNIFGIPVQNTNSSLFPSTANTGIFNQPQTNSNFQPKPGQPAFGQNEPDKQLIITSTKPILTLQSSNSLRYLKLSSFSDEFKKVINQIQVELMNNSLKISYAERLISRLEHNFKTVKSEGLNVVKLSKVINTKNTKIKLILNNLKTEMKKLNESLEKEKNNFRILQLGSDMTLIIPNDFLLYYTQELGERMKSYATQIEDIQSLINLYYSEESGNFKINSDMIEEVIVELYKCIKILLSDEAMLSEYVTSVKNSFALLLKNVGGFNEFQIKARFESYLDRDR